jgi:hypothetical protein
MRISTANAAFCLVCLAASLLVCQPAAAQSKGRWTSERAWQWYNQQPWLVGFNYIPSNCINYTEMWQKESFDPAAIDNELAVAQGVGFNCLRCVVQYLVWEHDPEGLKQRLDEFLKIAEKRGLKVTFCLFDDCVFGPKKDPYLGKQADVVPGWYAHDWAPSPGWSRVSDPMSWPKLQQYVEEILTRFKNDDRVLMWDLYNEPTNGIGPASLPLVEQVYQWARDVNPSQPLTLGVWNGDRRLNEIAINVADVMSFHDYSSAQEALVHITLLKKPRRPLICTEWLKRQNGSVETILPIFYQLRIGCMVWGLVNGKTQTHYSWGSKAGTPEPKLWQHDLFRKDLTPYDPNEIALFRSYIQKARAERIPTPTASVPTEKSPHAGQAAVKSGIGG